MLSQTTVTLIHALSRTNLIYNRKDNFPKYAQIYHYTELRCIFVFMLSKIRLSLIDIYRVLIMDPDKRQVIL